MCPTSNQPLTHLQKMLFTSSLKLPLEPHMFLLAASLVAHHDSQHPKVNGKAAAHQYLQLLIGVLTQSETQTIKSRPFARARAHSALA
jgi:hypothetical protein